MLQIRSNPIPTRELAPRTRPVTSPSTDASSFDGDPTAGPKRAGGLVLTRRVAQSIMIGDDIALEVVDVRPSVVRLRVVAPREVPVHRREIFDAIQSAPRVGRPASAPSNRGGGGLVLTRHAEQSIMIGEEVEVIVVGIKSGTVRLRIVAPREVAVHRLEIYDAIHQVGVGVEWEPAEHA